MRKSWSLKVSLLLLVCAVGVLGLFSGSNNVAAASTGSRCPVIPKFVVATLGKAMVVKTSIPFVYLKNWFGIQPVVMQVAKKGRTGRWIPLVEAPSAGQGLPADAPALPFTETSLRPAQAGLYRVLLAFQVNAAHRAMLQAANCGSGRKGSVGSFETVDGPPDFMFSLNIFRRIG